MLNKNNEMQKIKNAKNRRNKFYLLWGNFLLVLIFAQLFHLVSGWSKSGLSTPISFKEAIVEVFLNYQSWFLNIFLSGRLFI